MADMENTKNVIFAGMYKVSEEGYELRRQEFIKVFSDPKVFENEYYVFAILVKEFPKLMISKNFLNSFLIANRASLEKSTNIDLLRFKVSDDEEPYVEFLNSCKGMHDELQKVKFTNEEFMESLEIYKMNYITEQSISVLEESVQILTEGIKRRGKNVVGYDDMRTNLKNGFKPLDDLTNKRERKGIITYGINDMDDADTERAAVKLISPYGIKSLDDHVGGIWEGEMISLLAPAKGGKSRMSTYILHNAVINGTNILMWSIENGYKGWEALIRARHFDYFNNQNAGGDVTKRLWVDDDMIRKGNLEGRVKDMELASWTDLKSNHAYGKITSLDEDFNIDTFIEVIDNAVKMNDIKLICVDYLQLVQGSGNASKQERVAEAYQKMLQYLKGNKIAGIFPGQLKQSATGSLSKMDAADFVNTELRDAAGESYEVIKTPDVNLALYANVEELKQGRMRILSIPSRNHKQFDPIELNCQLGSCTFSDVNAVK
jgi:hypothetical protein